mmetsp:Transcript_22951/g.74774  ORF Transcript_22951/g.74774 Transcript_22951/m.74774 type:complete len:207 (-) Transcript_22951:60-680(-)
MALRRGAVRAVPRGQPLRARGARTSPRSGAEARDDRSARPGAPRARPLGRAPCRPRHARRRTGSQHPGYLARAVHSSSRRSGFGCGRGEGRRERGARSACARLCGVHRPPLVGAGGRGQGGDSAPPRAARSAALLRRLPRPHRREPRPQQPNHAPALRRRRRGSRRRGRQSARRGWRGASERDETSHAPARRPRRRGKGTLHRTHH